MELGLNQTVRSFMSRICGRSTHWAAENCYSLLCKFCPLSSSPLLFANAWNSELELEEGEGQIISDSTFSMGQSSKSVISPIVMSKRLNGRTEKKRRNGLRDNFISQPFFLQLAILSPWLPEGMKMKWRKEEAQWKSQNTHLKVFGRETRGDAIRGSELFQAFHTSRNIIQIFWAYSERY